MASVRFHLKDKKTGKKLGDFKWPVTPMTRIDESGLTKKQKVRLKKLVNDQIKIVKDHFKDGAWDLDAKSLLHDIVDDFFGFNLTDLFLTNVCHKAGVSYEVKLKGSVYTNETKKVFYNPVKNKLYIDTKARDVDNDVQLGDL